MTITGLKHSFQIYTLPCVPHAHSSDDYLSGLPAPCLRIYAVYYTTWLCPAEGYCVTRTRGLPIVAWTSITSQRRHALSNCPALVAIVLEFAQALSCACGHRFWLCSKLSAHLAKPCASFMHILPAISRVDKSTALVWEISSF